MKSIVARKADGRDIPAIAALHARAFRGFFLAELGSRFLTEYYKLVHGGIDGVLIVAEIDGRLSGFVSGTLRPAVFYGRMSANRRRLAGPLLRALLVRPRLLPRIVHNILRVRKEAGADPRDCAELTSIAVDPECGGQGLGRVLVDSFLADAAGAGATRVRLTTDADDNDRVNEFYRNRGFRLEEVKAAVRGRRMNVYVIDL